MSLLAALAVLAVGLVAGTVNTIVGSGSLITFPTLLALGYAPVLANVSNTIGLVPGSVSGAVGYRRELEGQRRRITVLGIASATGGLTGAVLLLVLPPTVFRSVVPVLILVACGLIAVQPRLARRVAAREGPERPHGGPFLFAAVYATGVYGGYFGAAQGVILIALLGIFLDDGLQRLNAAKNVLAGPGQRGGRRCCSSLSPTWPGRRRRCWRVAQSSAASSAPRLGRRISPAGSGRSSSSSGWPSWPGCCLSWRGAPTLRGACPGSGR